MGLVVSIQLTYGVTTVNLDRPAGKTEGLGDLAAGKPITDALHYFNLALSQSCHHSTPQTEQCVGSNAKPRLRPQSQLGTRSSIR